MHTTKLAVPISVLPVENPACGNHAVFLEKLVGISRIDGVRPGVCKMLAVCVFLYKLLKDWPIDLYEMERLVKRLYGVFTPTFNHCGLLYLLK
jgi:hypothetical protein